MTPVRSVTVRVVRVIVRLVRREGSVEDEEAEAVLKTVGRQVKVWREAAGLRQAELGSAIGYGEEMVSSVERGRRIPKPDFLDKADDDCIQEHFSSLYGLLHEQRDGAYAIPRWDTVLAERSSQPGERMPRVRLGSG